MDGALIEERMPRNEGRGVIRIPSSSGSEYSLCLAFLSFSWLFFSITIFRYSFFLLFLLLCGWRIGDMNCHACRYGLKAAQVILQHYYDVGLALRFLRNCSLVLIRDAVQTNTIPMNVFDECETSDKLTAREGPMRCRITRCVNGTLLIAADSFNI